MKKKFKIAKQILSMNILLIGRYPDFVLRELEKKLKKAKIVHTNRKDTRRAEKYISRTKVIIVTPDIRIDKNFLKSAKSLETLITFSHGYEHVDLRALERKGIKFYTMPGSTPSVAELTFGLMISVLRKIPEHDKRMKRDEWKKDFGHELYSKTLGVIGLGPIGREVCRIAKSFGMNIVACDPNNLMKGGFNIKIVNMKRLLKISDVVSLHAHLTPETKHTIGRKELRAMKKSAILINTARGGLVDSGALYKALRSGMIAGAGLDVFEKEPPGRDRLVGLPNVVSTPHAGADTIEGEERKVGMLLNMLRKAR
jgi:phosphoglycerate dehydrogenase-like enzyme